MDPVDQAGKGRRHPARTYWTRKKPLRRTPLRRTTLPRTTLCRTTLRRTTADRGAGQGPSAGAGRGAGLRGVAALHAAAPLRVPRVSGRWSSTTCGARNSTTIAARALSRATGRCPGCASPCKHSIPRSGPRGGRARGTSATTFAFWNCARVTQGELPDEAALHRWRLLRQQPARS